MTILNLVAAFYAALIGGAIVFDAAGWGTAAGAFTRGLAVLSMGYLAMLALFAGFAG